MGAAHRPWVTRMMKVFRIENRKYQDSTLSGIGAELYGGRWNEVGEKVVYCAGHRSLAMLEVMAHVQHRSLFPVDRLMLTLEVPGSIQTLDKSILHPRWMDITTYQWTSFIFNEFCLKPDKIGLLVPSVIVPEEYNVVLNPMHKSFNRVKVIEAKKMQWDDRLI